MSTPQKLRRKDPTYRRHSTRDFAFIEVGKKRIRLRGSYDSAESRAHYHELIAQLRRREITLAELTDSRKPNELLVAELVVRYLDRLIQRHDGRNRGDYINTKNAVNKLAAYCGAGLAHEFGPKRLREFQQHLAETPKTPGKHAPPNAPQKMLARSYVNDAVARVKGMFKWAVSEELVPPSAYHALETVRGLKRGQTTARETPNKKPVPLAHIAAIRHHVPPVVRAMLRVQTLTGVRSESICYAVPEQFDRTGDVWLWRPKHKTERLGKELIVPIGPRCQRVLRRWLDSAKPGQFIFSPRTVAANRKYNKHYETQSYCTAVVRGIRKANRTRKPEEQIPHWTPHQIRHLKGTTINDEYGIEAAQAMLGHDSLSATKIYSGRRLKLAKEIAKETG